MIQTSLSKRIALIAAGGLMSCFFTAVVSSAAEIKVLTSVALTSAFNELAPNFEQATGNKLNIAIDWWPAIMKPMLGLTTHLSIPACVHRGAATGRRQARQARRSKRARPRLNRSSASNGSFVITIGRYAAHISSKADMGNNRMRGERSKAPHRLRRPLPHRRLLRHMQRPCTWRLDRQFDERRRQRKVASVVCQ